MDLDLQQDAADVYAYISSRALAFNPTSDHGPGGTAQVKMVYAGYEFDQAGWFALIFDRRLDAGHDGEWTLYLDDNMLDRPTWAAACERNCELPIRIRGEDGMVRDLPAETEFGPLIGRMLVGVLQRAERDGVFARLPRADGFLLGLEEFNGSLGWDSQMGYGGQPE